MRNVGDWRSRWGAEFSYTAARRSVEEEKGITLDDVESPKIKQL
jgi:hypothetical protein